MYLCVCVYKMQLFKVEISRVYRQSSVLVFHPHSSLHVCFLSHCLPSVCVFLQGDCFSPAGSWHGGASVSLHQRPGAAEPPV